MSAPKVHHCPLDRERSRCGQAWEYGTAVIAKVTCRKCLSLLIRDGASAFDQLRKVARPARRSREPKDAA